ncbi:FAD-dependent oxidoreductase, partial [Patescibacteria group bacterium]|nr:FAD-dependent oxidoreductase [Patescibacteria group bacterium]
MTDAEKPIVVIGGGFGGLRLARRLSTSHGALARPIILIDQHAHHVYTPLLYEVASACTHSDAEEEALLGATTFHFSQLVSRYSGVTFLQEKVEAVDCAAKTVTLGSGKKLIAGTLVFALGSEPDFFGIPGLEEKALTLKTRESARLIRSRIMAFLEKKKAGQEVNLRLFVGGGGATGVELAAELAGAFHALERNGTLGKSDWSVTLVEALPRLLSMTTPAVSELAKRRLESLGVTVHLDTCIKRMEDGRVVLAPRPLREGEKTEQLVCAFRTEGEKTFETDMLIWTGGVRGSSFMQKTGLPLDRKGRVVVHGGMGIADHPGVYAIGDCAVPTNPVTNTPVPLLAQAAISQADVAATQILADHGVAIPRKTYTFPHFVYAIPLGGKQAIAVIGGVTL